MTSGWTTDTLKEYVDRRFADSELRISDARHSVERAEDQAGTTRLYAEQKSNEFRGQLSDQAATFMPRGEADQRFIAMSKGIDELRRLVYIATGLAMAAAIAIPLLMRSGG
jgi:hypothetical protein